MTITNNTQLKELAGSVLRHPMPQPGSIDEGRVVPKNQDFVIAILKRSGYMNKTRLQKLAFLAELEFIEDTGDRLTDLEFYRWDWGPFSPQLQNTVMGMHENIELIENTNPFDPSQKETVLKLIDDTTTGALPEDRFLFVELLCGTFRYHTTDKLKILSKRNDVFQGTEQGELIDLDALAKKINEIMNRIDHSPKFAARARHLNEVRKKGQGRTYPTCAAYIRTILK